MRTRRNRKQEAVAVFDTPEVKGEVVARTCSKGGIDLIATFHKIPQGKHGFHIHKAGDMRGEGCKGLCEHYDKGKNTHGAGPHSKTMRHTGDLGNLLWTPKTKTLKRRYCLKDVSVSNLWGRSIIVHADEDDLGKGSHEDSKITGHSGARLACAIFGRSCIPSS